MGNGLVLGGEGNSGSAGSPNTAIGGEDLKHCMDLGVFEEMAAACS